MPGKRDARDRHFLSTNRGRYSPVSSPFGLSHPLDGPFFHFPFFFSSFSLFLRFLSFLTPRSSGAPSSPFTHTRAPSAREHVRDTLYIARTTVLHGLASVHSRNRETHAPIRLFTVRERDNAVLAYASTLFSIIQTIIINCFYCY